MYPIRNGLQKQVRSYLTGTCPACPVGRNYRTGVEFTCDSGAYSSGVGRNYRTGVKSLLHLFLWGNSGRLVCPPKTGNPLEHLYASGVLSRGALGNPKSRDPLPFIYFFPMSYELSALFRLAPFAWRLCLLPFSNLSYCPKFSFIDLKL